jgi:alpha-tubulin suppressor-like RCC1 family protein
MPNFSGIWNLKEQVQAIAAGRWTGLPTGELYGWGANSSGQIGDNTVVNKSSPVQIDESSDWSKVSGLSAAFHVSALKLDGSLWTWGSGTFGKLGHNSTTDLSSPVQVGSLTSWYDTQVANAHTLAIQGNYTLWAWGRGLNGRLGDNSIVDKSSPVQIGALTNWAALGAAHAASFAVKLDGSLWAWGDNDFGALGLNGTTDTIGHKSSPVQIGALTNWAQVSGGSRFAAAVKTDGTAWAWGYGAQGQLGNNASGSAASRSSPVQIGALTAWSQVGAGGYHVTAVKTDGTLWAWGSNGFGRLGDGTVVSRSSPVQIGALTNWAQSSGGTGFSAAAKTDGTLWAWGDNSPSGQLGDGTVVDKSSPVQVGALTNWSQVAATGNHAAAILQGSTN